MKTKDYNDTQYHGVCPMNDYDVKISQIAFLIKDMSNAYGIPPEVLLESLTTRVTDIEIAELDAELERCGYDIDITRFLSMNSVSTAAAH
jgi:hypothetical protein